MFPTAAVRPSALGPKEGGGSSCPVPGFDQPLSCCLGLAEGSREGREHPTAEPLWESWRQSLESGSEIRGRPAPGFSP